MTLDIFENICALAYYMYYNILLVEEVSPQGASQKNPGNEPKYFLQFLPCFRTNRSLVR